MSRIRKVLDAIDNPENYGDMKWKHIAALLINHKIVSIGSCNHRTRVGDKNIPSIHAELHALMLYLGSHNIKNVLYTSNKGKNKNNNNKYYLSNSKNRKYNKMLHNMRNAEVVVIRKAKNDTICHYLESRPCNECVKMLKQFGIKKVHYSNACGEIITEKVKTMNYCHDTPGNIRYRNKLFK